MSVENGAPTYRNQYCGCELGFKAPDPSKSGGIKASILYQSPLEQSGVLQEQSGYTSEQLAFSGNRTDVWVAPSARIRCWVHWADYCSLGRTTVHQNSPEALAVSLEK
jgi:hypothetical protein